MYFSCVEALQNAAKHAGAARIQVRVATRDDELSFEVSDDGVGFDGRPAAGSGIDGIARRVTEAGGVAELTSRPGVGTRLDCRLPIAIGRGEPLRESA